jgi:N-acetylmuramoyl-L-alanine amidase
VVVIGAPSRRPAVVAAAILFLALAAGATSGDGASPAASAPAFSGVAKSRRPPLAGKVVAVDPGHNGGNGAHPGAIARPVVAYANGRTKACDTVGTETNDGRLTESRFNLEVARDLAERLRALGARVVMTRRTNSGVGPCIDRRAAIGNRAEADAAISIHADGVDAAGARGFDVIYPRRAQLVRRSIQRPSRRLALRLRGALVKAGISPANYVGKRGLDTRRNLGGLNLSTVPKVFAELGNMRSPREAAKLESARYRARLAGALAAGIKSYLRR